MEPARMIVGGGVREAASGATSDVVDPATGEVIGRSADTGPDEAREACDKAADAQRRWAHRSPRERSEVLRACWSAILAPRTSSRR